MQINSFSPSWQKEKALPMQCDVRLILQGIGTQKFFRLSPAVNTKIVQHIEAVLNSGKKELNFLYLWGAHKKKDPGQLENEAIDFLEKLMACISEAFDLKCHITFVLCDLHGLRNKVPEELISSYMSGMTRLCKARNFKSILLSQVLPNHFYDTVEVDTSAVIEKLPATVYQRLLKGSSHHYFGMDKVKGVERYLTTRLSERHFLAGAYQDHIFLSGAMPSTEFLQPPLPTMWIWTTSRRKTILPWFNTLEPKNEE